MSQEKKSYTKGDESLNCIEWRRKNTLIPRYGSKRNDSVPLCVINGDSDFLRGRKSRRERSGIAFPSTFTTLRLTNPLQYRNFLLSLSLSPMSLIHLRSRDDCIRPRRFSFFSHNTLHFFRFASPAPSSSPLATFHPFPLRIRASNPLIFRVVFLPRILHIANLLAGSAFARVEQTLQSLNLFVEVSAPRSNLLDSRGLRERGIVHVEEFREFEMFTVPTGFLYHEAN